MNTYRHPNEASTSQRFWTVGKDLLCSYKKAPTPLSLCAHRLCANRSSFLFSATLKYTRVNQNGGYIPVSWQNKKNYSWKRLIFCEIAAINVKMIDTWYWHLRQNDAWSIRHAFFWSLFPTKARNGVEIEGHKSLRFWDVRITLEMAAILKTNLQNGGHSGFMYSVILFLKSAP